MEMPSEGGPDGAPRPIPAPLEAPRRDRADPWRRWAASFERVWLDPVAEPFERRAASIGWARDAPGDYCDRCGHDVAEHEATEYGCAACRSMRPPWDRFVRLGAYEPPLSLWVQEVKFTRFHALARSLGRELGRAAVEAGVREWGGGPERVVVTPVPSTLRRRLVRGIDHARVLAGGVGREIGAPVRCVLGRAHRPSQRSVAPSARGANVRGAFRLVRGGLGGVGGAWGRDSGGVAGRLVVLVDDVSTSAATVRGCSRVLLEAGAAGVWVASVSVTRETGRMEGAAARGEGGRECGQVGQSGEKV